MVATNRKAHHDYFILERFEAGMVLVGTEVKSLRAGRANLREAFARVENGEVFLYNLHISPWDYGNRWNHEPTRTRKLLLHKDEIRRLVGKTREAGKTLIPLRIYFTPRGRAKVELALAQGKKLWDKRESIARRDEAREIQRRLKQRA